MNKQTEIMQLAKNELPQLKALIKLNAPKGTDVETLALQELEYLQMIGLQQPAIYECIPETIIAAIKATLKQNLTLDPYAGLVYVKTRGIKVGVDGNGKEIWKTALEIQPSANGIISIARQAGRLLDVDRPEVIKDKDGKVTGVRIRFLTPSYNEKGQRCARWREVEFDETDFMRWRIASHKEKSRGKNDAHTKDYANANYTNWKGGPDPEFIRAKAIRHGLKKLGTNLNEKPIETVSVTTPIPDLHINIEKDVEAMNDEYINHEDVHNYESDSGNGTTVAAGDEIDIPKSSEL